MKEELVAKNPETLERVDRINNCYDYATGRNEALKSIARSELELFIDEAIKEIDLLEQVAEHDQGKFDLPREIAENIGTVWVFSGPGSYFEPKKEDRYKNYPWANWMDRKRLNHATRLIREITERLSGQNFKAPLSEIISAKRKIKEAILNYGPRVIYNGTPIENETVAKVLSEEGVIIPTEKVDIIEQDIKNTLDQITTILPEKFEKEKEIALVSHAPHLMRILRIINKYQPFPKGTKIRLFPLSTPMEGREEYAKMEISGALYYTYITQNATKQPYPYEISCTPEKITDSIKN